MEFYIYINRLQVLCRKSSPARCREAPAKAPVDSSRSQERSCTLATNLATQCMLRVEQGIRR
jgi:hypothetical protein